MIGSPQDSQKRVATLYYSTLLPISNGACINQYVNVFLLFTFQALKEVLHVQSHPNQRLPCLSIQITQQAAAL